MHCQCGKTKTVSKEAYDEIKRLKEENKSLKLSVDAKLFSRRKLESDNAAFKKRWDKLTDIVNEWDNSVTCPPDWEVFGDMKRMMKELENGT
jgi:predicted CopG family antitoxin